MSAVPDPKSAGHMTIWEHLGELRSRLIKVSIAVVAGAVLGWFVFPYLLDFLLEPFQEIQPDGTVIATEPLQAFSLRIRMSGYIGIAIAMPVILWQLWRFITPALYPHEKKYAVPFVLTSVVLFVLGGIVALLTLQPALEFLLNIGGSDLQPLLTADKYISLVSLMILAFGLAFEFPVILLFLLIARVLDTRQLRHWRRYAAVVIVAFAAIITPSQDPYSLFAMAVPMYLFYEGCIIIGRIMKR